MDRDNIARMFSESTFVQAAMAVIVTLTWVFLIVWGTIHNTTVQAPDIFVAITGLVFGYYFRAKTDVKSINTIKAMNAQQASGD